MDSTILDQFSEDITVDRQPSRGFGSDTFYCTYGGRSAVVKYSDELTQYHRLLREAEVCRILSKFDTVQSPQVIEVVDRGRDIAVMFEEVEEEIISSEMWSSLEYCRDHMESAVEFFNFIHTDEEFISKIKNSSHGYVCELYWRDFTLDGYDLDSYLSEDQKKISLDAVDYLSSTDPDRLYFGHNDFHIDNMGCSNGVYPVFDWEKSGYCDPMWEVSRFEGRFFDEMVREHHSREVVEDLRQEFRESLAVDVTDRLELYRYVRIVRSMNHIREDCSEKWLEVGTIEELYELKYELLDILQPVVEGILVEKGYSV